MYGQIISFLFVLLILYYVVMILLDIQKSKAAKAAELEKNPEEEIDISDEANTFQPIVISRDEPKKSQAAGQETEEKTGESAGQSKSEDCHQPDTNESDRDKKESPVDKPVQENATPAAPPVSPADPANPTNPDTENRKPESDKTGKKDMAEDDNRQDVPFRREGYREPLMTGGLTVDELLLEVDELVETGSGPLGEIIYECRSAHF